jgi:hypothetical protein
MSFPVLTLQVIQNKMRRYLTLTKELKTPANQVVFVYLDVAPQYLLGKNEKFHEDDARYGCLE